MNNNDERAHLKAIVSIWLTNGHMPVDAANETRTYVGSDWEYCVHLSESLERGEFIERLHPNRWDVVPTASGVFEAIS